MILARKNLKIHIYYEVLQIILHHKYMVFCGVVSGHKPVEGKSRGSCNINSFNLSSKSHPHNGA